MAYYDWMAVLCILPCLLFKSTRASALVLLLVFPFYCLVKYYTDTVMIRYLMFGTQDAIVCAAFIHLSTKNIYAKMESCIAILSASAVVYHFLGWSARANGVDNTFYVNACIIIVTMQVSMLYLRLIINGIFKNLDGHYILRLPNIFNYYHGGKLPQRTKDKKVSRCH